MPRQSQDVNILTSASTVNDLFSAFKAGFQSRKFSAGLLVAFIDMFEHLATPSLGLRGWDEFVARFPPLETNRRGAANTLTVAHRGNQLTLRRFYDPVETFFRAEHHRMDYPNCAPHATQAWSEARYRPWLDILVRSSARDLAHLRDMVVQFILVTLPDHSTFDAQEKAAPPLFTLALSGFDMAAQTGERSGAPFQGLVFGWLRADNPHLQVAASKVRSGGARHGAVGDIDAWSGARLTLTAEVKHFVMSEEDVTGEITDFAERVRQRASLGLVVALGFEGGAADTVANLGLVPLTLQDIADDVRLWETQKQAMAINFVTYCFLRLEMSAALTERFQAFIVRASEQWGVQPPDIAAGKG
jgi:hypothetical protein